VFIDWLIYCYYLCFDRPLLNKIEKNPLFHLNYPSNCFLCRLYAQPLWFYRVWCFSFTYTSKWPMFVTLWNTDEWIVMLTHLKWLELNLQWRCDLNSNHCPGRSGFKFMIPLNANKSLQCTEAAASEDSHNVQCTKDETEGWRCFSINHMRHGVSYNKNIYLFIYSSFNDTVNNSTPGTEPATVKQVYASDLDLATWLGTRWKARYDVIRVTCWHVYRNHAPCKIQRMCYFQFFTNSMSLWR
jgi:hypothetical protein